MTRPSRRGKFIPLPESAWSEGVPDGDDATDWDTGVYTPTAGAAVLIVQDEGSPLATAAGTMNFTGDGVTASGAGATKTINVPGGATASDTAIWRPVMDGAGAVITDGATGEAIMAFGPA